MCGPLAGLSGGDVHALRLVARWNDRRPGAALLLAPEMMRSKLPERARIRLRPVRTPLDGVLRGMLSYAAIVLIRTVRASFAAPDARVTIASSHFFHDVIPCVAHRFRRGSQPAAYVYHLVRDMDRPESLRSRLSVAAERFSVALLRRSRALVFVDNDEARESLAAAGIAPELIVPTRNAYDAEVAVPARTTGNRLVVFAGRFTQEKGIWDMLELARALAERMPEARIAMIGEGPLRHSLLARVEAEGLANVDAPGFVSEERKWALLRSADLFAAPSREEGWGIAVGEALTAELPAVVYDLPAYSHFGDLVRRVPFAETARFVDEAVGLLGDADALAALQRRVAAGAARLPSWDEILDAEIDRLQAMAVER